MKTKSTSRIPRTFIRITILLAITALALSTSPGSRADAQCNWQFPTNWTDGTGDWFNPLNWGPSHNAQPDCGVSCGHPLEVDINNAGTAQISTETAQACETVTAASVHAWKSGTLTGNGTVSTTSGTTIDGTLAPTGTLTISGDVDFGPGGTMRCNVSSSSWDRAEVSGTATVNGKLSVTLTGFFTGDFPILHASSLIGTFSSFSATYTGCLAPSIVYDYVNGYVYLHVEATCQ